MRIIIGVPLMVVVLIILLVRSFPLTGDDIRLYMGVYRGISVARPMCFVAGGVTGVYRVTTLPEYRNRGIGKHITRAPLLL